MDNATGFLGTYKPICNIRFLDDPQKDKSYIAIEEEEYRELLTSAMTFQALESGGVDNWEWYGLSIHDYCEFLKSECYDEETLREYVENIKDVNETVEDTLDDFRIKDFADFEIATL